MLVLVLVLCFVGVGVVLIVLVLWLVGWLLCQIGNIQSWGDTEHPRDGTLHVLCSTPQQLNKGAKEQRNKGAKEQKGNEANQEKTSLRRLNDGSPGNSSCHHSNDQKVFCRIPECKETVNIKLKKHHPAQAFGLRCKFL